MKLDKRKFEYLLAVKCLKINDLNACRSSVYKALNGYDVTPYLIGTIAAALGVDPAEIIEEGDKC